MARSRAALGEPLNAGAHAMGVPANVAVAASSNPLPVARDAEYLDSGAVAPDAPLSPAPYWADSRGGCADAWGESIYGVGAAARNNLLNAELPAKGQANREAERAVQTARKQHGEGSREYIQAMAVWQAASKDYLATRAKYERLPEEADAWAVEGLLR